MPEALNDQRIAAFRQQIRDVAIGQFASRGAARVSMRSIARELGYSATALYSYYRDKEEILAAARAAAFERLAGRLQAAARADAKSQDANQYLRVVARAYLTFVREEPAAYELMLTPLLAGRERYPELDLAQARLRQLLETCFEQIAETRALAAEPTLLARVYWCTLHGALSLGLTGGLGLTGIDMDGFIDDAVTVFAAGALAEGEDQKSARSNQQFSLF